MRPLVGAMIIAGVLVTPVIVALARGSGEREDAEDGPRVAAADVDDPDVLRARFEEERVAWARREAELFARIDQLETLLNDERRGRLAREAEWLEFTQALSSLEVESAPEPPEFAQVERVEAEAPDPGALAREENARRHAARVRADLRAHLIAEQVLGLDVLEVGTVHEGWTGPIVLRTLDDNGRPLSTLAAERLRLEASRSGHAIVLVLEEGYERYGEQRIPFGPLTEEGAERAGVRRIHLPGVDPKPWIEAFPELFDPDVLLGTPDDGLHDLIALRMTVDSLLRADSSAGHWRLRELGGVADGELRDVQLVEIDRRGNLLRRLFADRLRIRRSGEGLELALHDGVQERHGKKSPFLQGVYRIFLPRADAGDWERAGVPGL